MVERGQRLGFALEARDAFGVGGERLWQHLDGDLAIELGIARAIDLTHPAHAKQRADLVRAEASTCSESHVG